MRSVECSKVQSTKMEGWVPKCLGRNGRGAFSAFSPACSPPAFCLAPAACISNLSRACVIFDIPKHGRILEIDSQCCACIPLFLC